MPRPALCPHRGFHHRGNPLITLRLPGVGKIEGLGHNGRSEEQQNSGAKE